MGHPTGLLHERDDALIELNLALAKARAGHGELALATGEAGAGKTSAIREFLGHTAGNQWYSTARVIRWRSLAHLVR